MKQIVIMLCLLFVFITNNKSSGQCDPGASQVIISSLSPGLQITVTNPITNLPKTLYSGVINGTVDGNFTRFYCVDFFIAVHLIDSSYTDTCGYVPPKVQYILHNYYPRDTTNPAPLTNNQEAAAIGVAIWHFTDGVNPNTVTNVVVRDRAVAIVADANANGGIEQPVITFKFIPGIEPDGFFVQTRNADNVGIPITNIQLSISSGSLSDTLVDTDASGLSPEIIVSASLASVITAEATIVYTPGSLFHSLNLNSQVLASALPVLGRLRIQTDWGALPVELSSFTATVLGSKVTLQWTTASEINNAGFDVERFDGNGEWVTMGNVAGNGTISSPVIYSFIDQVIVSGTYQYRLKQFDYNGNYEYFNLYNDVIVGVPGNFSLSQNYPNPFNPNTTINFTLPIDAIVHLQIYDNTGKEIANLLNTEQKKAGYYTINFDGSNFSTGIYYYKLTTSNFSQTKKMMLIK